MKIKQAFATEANRSFRTLDGLSSACNLAFKIFHVFYVDSKEFNDESEVTDDSYTFGANSDRTFAYFDFCDFSCVEFGYCQFSNFTQFDFTSGNGFQ